MPAVVNFFPFKFVRTIRTGSIGQLHLDSIELRYLASRKILMSENNNGIDESNSFWFFFFINWRNVFVLF